MANKSKLTSLLGPWATIHNAGALLDVEIAVVPDTASDLPETVGVTAVPGNRLIWPLNAGVAKGLDGIASDALVLISADSGHFNVLKDANDGSTDTLPLDFKQFEMPLSMTPHRPNTPHGAIRGQDYTVQDNTVVFPLWTDLSADVHDVQGDDAPKRYSTVLRGLKPDGTLDLRFSGPLHTAVMLGSSYNHFAGEVGGYLSKGNKGDDWRQVPGPVAMLNCLGQHILKPDKYGNVAAGDPSAGGQIVTYAGSMLQSAFPGGGINFFQAARVGGALAVGHLATGITLSKSTAATDLGPFIVPFDPSGQFDKHFVGTHAGEDEREYAETAGRISTNAFFFNDFQQDGPLWFNSKRRPRQVIDYAGPFYQAHCVWNEQGLHRFGNEWRPGWWEWIVSVPIEPARPVTGPPDDPVNEDRPVTGGAGGGGGGAGSIPAIVPHWLASVGRVDLALSPNYLADPNRRIDGYRYDPADRQQFLQGAMRSVVGTNPTPVRGQELRNADTVAFTSPADGKAHLELLDADGVRFGWRTADESAAQILSVASGNLSIDGYGAGGAPDLLKRIFNNGRRLPRVVEADANPTTVADDTAGYQPGDLWRNTGSNAMFVCASAATAAAVWIQIQVAAGGITQLTGDVTAGPGSGTQTATIADAAVTLAKMANLAGARLIGRRTGAAAVPEAITLGTGLSMGSGAGGPLSNSAPSKWTPVEYWYELRRIFGTRQVIDQMAGPVTMHEDSFNHRLTDYGSGDRYVGENVWWLASTGELAVTVESIDKASGWEQAQVALFSDGGGWTFWNGMLTVQAGADPNYVVALKIEFRVEFPGELPGVYWRIGCFDSVDPGSVANSISIIATTDSPNFLLEVMNAGTPEYIDTGYPLDNQDHLVYLYASGNSVQGCIDGNTFANDPSTSTVPTGVMGFGKQIGLGFNSSEPVPFIENAVCELGHFAVMKPLPDYTNVLG